jgi:hypothetical protein
MEPMHLTIGGKAVKTSRNQEIYNPFEVTYAANLYRTL